MKWLFEKQASCLGVNWDFASYHRRAVMWFHPYHLAEDILIMLDNDCSETSHVSSLCTLWPLIITAALYTEMDEALHILHSWLTHWDLGQFPFFF